MDAMADAEYEPFMKAASPDIVISFANSGPIAGLEGLRAALDQLYGISASIRHEVISEWVIGNEIIVEAVAHHDRRSDGKKFQIPSVTIITLNDDRLVTGWRAYLDPSPLYAE